MCGILAILLSAQGEKELRVRAMEQSRKQRHRGPDWTGLHVTHFKKGGRAALAHERLAIVDVASGEQPLLSPDGSVALCVNGEIYNHTALRSSLLASHPERVAFLTHSDCEVILPLYDLAADSGADEDEPREKRTEAMAEALGRLDGMFAFVLVDEKRERIVVARDPIGICSLYYGWGQDGTLWFASEMKALEGHCRRFEQFPPGHFWDISLGRADALNGKPLPFYTPQWYADPSFVPSLPAQSLALQDQVLRPLQETVERAVTKMLMCDVPYGVLLSGGLDSSLVAAIASRHAALRVEDNERSPAWFPRLHSFSIGVPGSPDLHFARRVADFLGTVHHEWTFTPQQGIDALSDVIYHIETYDVTTIRASTPMFLLARRIKATGIKMVLSGEGADEIFGGYLYFHKAPDATALHQETVRKIKALHQYDCLRANKALLAWGVEGRFPFLDSDVLDLAMSRIDPVQKLVLGKEAAADPRRPIEKYILRKAFDRPEDAFLPDEVLWRQKEQFSDGVGYSWIDTLRAHADQTISDAQMQAAAHLFPHNTPTTKEAYLYRTIFQSHFPSDSAVATVPGGPSVACSSAVAVEWDASWKNRADPSGRAVAVHQSSLEAAQQ